jgi:hypothetical protein
MFLVFVDGLNFRRFTCGNSDSLQGEMLSVNPRKLPVASCGIFSWRGTLWNDNATQLTSPLYDTKNKANRVNK